jgi:hypothetical protein
MTAADREACLKAMHSASSAFYTLAVRAGNHAFIEFTGLMNEYINLCQQAHEQGIDFTMLNVHTGQHLPFQAHHFNYLAEKLECIYGINLMLARKHPPPGTTNEP